MVRPLVGADLVGMTVGEMEARPAILHRHAPAWNHHARTETGVITLNEADATALRIGGAEQDGSARLGNTSIERLGLGRVNSIREFLQSGGRQQLCR